MGIWIKHFENINLSMGFEWISLRIRTGTWESRPIPRATDTAFSFKYLITHLEICFDIFLKFYLFDFFFDKKHLLGYDLMRG